MDTKGFNLRGLPSWPTPAQFSFIFISFKYPIRTCPVTVVEKAEVPIFNDFKA